MFRYKVTLLCTVCVIVHSLPTEIIKDDMASIGDGQPIKDDDIDVPAIGGGGKSGNYSNVINISYKDNSNDKDEKVRNIEVTLGKDKGLEGKRGAQDILKLDVVLNRNGNKSDSAKENKSKQKVKRQTKDDQGKPGNSFDDIIDLHVSLDNDNRKKNDKEGGQKRLQERDANSESSPRGAKNIIQLLARLGDDGKDNKENNGNKKKKDQVKQRSIDSLKGMRDTDRISLLARLGDDGKGDDNEMSENGKQNGKKPKEREAPTSIDGNQDSVQIDNSLNTNEKRQYENDPTPEKRNAATADAIAKRKKHEQKVLAMAKSIEAEAKMKENKVRRNDRIDLLAKLGGNSRDNQEEGKQKQEKNKTNV